MSENIYNLNFEEERIYFTPIVLYTDYINLQFNKYLKENFKNITPRDFTYLSNIFYHQGCINCGIYTKVCPRANIILTEEKPVLEDDCEFCLGCVHHCKNKVFTINNEPNDERYINSHIKISEIIKSNNLGD